MENGKKGERSVKVEEVKGEKRMREAWRKTRRGKKNKGKEENLVEVEEISDWLGGRK